MNAVTVSVRPDARQAEPPPWTVLVVDDEPEVHAVTRLALRNFRFADRHLHFLSAHSAAEAEVILRENADIAVMLLDVVMETDRAGLDLVRVVREQLGNQFVRIVLRTGQPGQAPEQQVIAAYDINDYKEKTELTAQKLATTMFAALRSYRDMRTIEANRRGLERVIAASAYIFSHEHSQRFPTSVLEQLTEMPGLGRSALYCKVARVDTPMPEHFRVESATGSYRNMIDRNADERLPQHVVASLRRAWVNKRHVFSDDHYVLHISDERSPDCLIYVGEGWNLSDLDHRLLEVFGTNVAIAYENLHLSDELFDSQMEMVHLLAGAAETRSSETANHVRRVGLIAELLGQLYGMDEKTTEALRLAAPMHDIGKIGIPDAILNKPGSHTSDETVLKLAAEIAASHHENWDGSGYPNGLRGEAIPIGGRITMLADVFDALGSRRCYKEPWPIDDIRAFIVEQNGIKFEPRLVELLFEHWDRVQAVRSLLPD
jgi:response regulator RpfG family c-di-GMP phosphodiesterase